jgi:DNA-directed RNA polymerase specialized sigma24 family protein
MEQKCQGAEPNSELTGEELTRKWVRSVTADAIALFRETYPDFAHQVTQFVLGGNRLISRNAAPAAFHLPSERTQRLNSDPRVDLAARILAEYGSAIRLMLRQHVSANQEERDEVYQNLYLSLIRNPPPRPLANVTPYLNAAIQNDIGAMRQRRGQWEMVSRFVMSRVREDTDSFLGDLMTQAEEAQRVRHCIAKLLPAHEARAVIERYVYGYRTTEVALHMQARLKTVARYVYDALRRVRQVVSRA